MTTIDDLIAEGKTFEVKYEEPRFEYEDGINKLYEGFYYINNGQNFYNWIEKSKRFIQTNFPGDIALDRFIELSSQKNIDNVIICNLVAVLVSLKDIPCTCPKVNENVTAQNYITINQSQEQSVNIDIFFDVLKNSLSNEQYDALKDVIQKSDNINVAKSKIMDKLKSFGESVMSNIIASLITNPSIWNNLHI